MIPKRLQREEFRFIRIKAREKYLLKRTGRRNLIINMMM